MEWEAEENELENSIPWGGKGQGDLGTEVLLFRGALSHCPAKVRCVLPKIKDCLGGTEATVCVACGVGGRGLQNPPGVYRGAGWMDRVTLDGHLTGTIHSIPQTAI